MDLIGLDLDISYNLFFVIKYNGGEVSDLVLLFFKINELFFILIGGVIVGIVIGKIEIFFECFVLNFCEKNLFLIFFIYLLIN